jgi:hypothetical protein
MNAADVPWPIINLADVRLFYANGSPIDPSSISMAMSSIHIQFPVSNYNDLKTGAFSHSAERDMSPYLTISTA